MSILFSPNDSDVELDLGELQSTWKLRPPEEMPEGCIADTFAVNHAVFALLILGGFALGVFSVWTVSKVANNIQIGALFGGTLLVAAVVLLNRSHSVAYSLIRLSAFKSGFRLGRKQIRFEELQSVEMGASIPLSEKIIEAGNKYIISPRKREAAYESLANRRRSRRTALVLRLTNGKRFVWLSFFAIFAEPDIEEFFAIVKRLAPHVELTMAKTD